METLTQIKYETAEKLNKHNLLKHTSRNIL